MEPFRDRSTMDPRSMQPNTGGGGSMNNNNNNSNGPPSQPLPPGSPAGRLRVPGGSYRGSPPSRVGAAQSALVRPPDFLGPSPSHPQHSNNYLGQPLAAPPPSAGHRHGQQQPQQHHSPSASGQNQRLLQLQMQRQQQLRQLHQQRRHQQANNNPSSSGSSINNAASSSNAATTPQQQQNLSQLQQNFMKEERRSSIGGPGTGAPLKNTVPASGAVKPNGLGPPPPSLGMQLSPSSGNHSTAAHRGFLPSSPANQGSKPSLHKPMAHPNTAGASAAARPNVSTPSAPVSATAKSSSSNQFGPGSMAPPAAAVKVPTASPVGPKVSTTAPTTPPPPLPVIPDKAVPGLLKQCDWKDRTLWVSRQLLGGQALNGFLKATATVQRIKRQRVRQTRTKDSTTPTGKADDASVNSNPSMNDSNNAKKREADPNNEEEDAKLQVMNARTAKKIKTEMDLGLHFCEQIHETIRGILKELDVPGVVPPPALGRELPATQRAASMVKQAPPSTIAKPSAMTKQTSRATSTASSKGGALPAGPLTRPPSMAAPTAVAGSAKSTLRKNRRKKLPPSGEPSAGLSEFDATGKRLFSKKDHSQRVFEVKRFRALRQGDHVAARLSSRDLWILARVTKSFPGVNLPVLEFLQLSKSRRDSLFREKVTVRDVEDKDSMTTSVARSLVLPLPRSASEASEWGQHYRKGMRVYAMYPETTSLYTATVIDNTTYCQGDNDIVVVEFDGDEPDATGSPPRCHIPAGFVTLIPREFPGAQDKAARRASTLTAASAQGSTAGQSFSGFDDPLNNLDLSLDAMQSFDGFDDLEFDLEFD
jgi:hypothetical protein